MKNSHKNHFLICICGASPLEIFWIKRGLKKITECKEGSAMYLLGAYLNQNILLVQSGIGGKNIRGALRDLPLKSDIGLAINIGCTGSLLPYLGIAHINIPCKIKLDKQSGLNYLPQEKIMIFARSTGISFKIGKLHFLPALTVKKALNMEEKMTLHRDEPEVGCIDLESFYFARFFSEYGIPYMIVRAVSDTLDFRLPPVSYLSPICWTKPTYIPKILKQFPDILRFHLAVIRACWTNQRFVNHLLHRIGKLEI